MSEFWENANCGENGQKLIQRRLSGKFITRVMLVKRLFFLLQIVLSGFVSRTEFFEQNCGQVSFCGIMEVSSSIDRFGFRWLIGVVRVLRTAP